MASQRSPPLTCEPQGGLVFVLTVLAFVEITEINVTRFRFLKLWNHHQLALIVQQACPPLPPSSSFPSSCPPSFSLSYFLDFSLGELILSPSQPEALSCPAGVFWARRADVSFLSLFQPQPTSEERTPSCLSPSDLALWGGALLFPRTYIFFHSYCQHLRNDVVQRQRHRDRHWQSICEPGKDMWRTVWFLHFWIFPRHWKNPIYWWNSCMMSWFLICASTWALLSTVSVIKEDARIPGKTVNAWHLTQRSHAERFILRILVHVSEQICLGP